MPLRKGEMEKRVRLRWHAANSRSHSLESGSPESLRTTTGFSISPFLRGMSFAVLLAVGCASDGRSTPSPPATPFDPTSYVDPFIGTGGHGHTFPGATVPFGMVQLSPDTRLEGWDGCSGYHHDDEWIYGFSHTHLSGTGCSDYGDILLMPGVGDVVFDNGADGKRGYRQHFSHANETASPGFYSVVLDSGVKCEMTATTRVGVHRYTFPPGTKTAHVLVDLAHRDKVLESGMRTSGDREIVGMRRSRAWAQDQTVYFAARFSKSVALSKVDGFALEGVGFSTSSNDGAKWALDFSPDDGAPLVVTVGISAVDEAGARRNLDAECPDFDFDRVRDAARETWRSQLAKIEVHGGTDAQLRTFYTALYHCCIAPNVFSDVDGRYRGRDMKIHQTSGWTQYTVFSLWDTFRALHPLMTVIEPARTNDFINTFLAQYREGGALPVWELAANETNCMIGYHAVPVIADAYAKGIRGYDANAALDAMVASADRDARGLKEYRECGFVPSDKEGESVSKTLEYAYDDWCIAEMGRALKRYDVVRDFGVRSQSWKNLLDPKTGFFRPRRNNAWVEPFDPAEVNNHYTEANAWQYSMFVPHDVDGLAAALGGFDKLSTRLDELFIAPSSTSGRDQADITGMIGQYAHGNEPSHHMAWLYVYAGRPWKAQQRVRAILDTLYSDRLDGLCGNEDCGQMSAWYVMSALGLYAVCPGRPEYALGTPLFPDVVIHLDDGRAFAIRVAGKGAYVESANLRGADHLVAVLRHADLVAGGELDLVAGETSSTWGTDPLAAKWGGNLAPHLSDSAPSIQPVPFVARGGRVFADSTDVELGSLDSGPILYSLDGGKTVQRYEQPIHIDATTELVCWRSKYRGGMSSSWDPKQAESKRAAARFVKQSHAWTLTLAHPYAPQYAADGPNTLIDGLRGGGDWRTGGWQGFQGDDVDATIDLGAARDVDVVRVGFFRDVGSWIWLPTQVRVAVSDDGTTFRDAGAMTTNVDEHDAATGPLYYEFHPKTRARFVRVVGVNRGACPAWHPGAGHKAWLFADEIEVE